MATICTFFTFSVFTPKLGGSVGPWEVLCLELCCDGNDGEAFPFLAQRYCPGDRQTAVTSPRSGNVSPRPRSRRKSTQMTQSLTLSIKNLIIVSLTLLEICIDFRNHAICRRMQYLTGKPLLLLRISTNAIMTLKRCYV